jgi:CRP-like cAMP-binding protein
MFRVQGTHFYINCCGRMDVIVNGKKVVSLESQTAVGELSLLSDELTTADVVASTDVQLLALSREDFNTMLGPLKVRVNVKVRQEYSTQGRVTHTTNTEHSSACCTVDSCSQEIIANEFKRAVITKVKLLQLLSDFEIDALVQACGLERYHDGQVIITEGEVGNTFHMMKSGQVKVTKNERCAHRLCLLAS